ncbi:hypothetical protein ILYODFUR_008137 [Ilyodon furcidens]|uniref:Uncharacterized protein n=1 Tax=Ilyodon furcidens TaxID=33524 RepID=A0ABV0V257_9TELE
MKNSKTANTSCTLGKQASLKAQRNKVHMPLYILAVCQTIKYCGTAPLISQVRWKPARDTKHDIIRQIDYVMLSGFLFKGKIQMFLIFFERLWTVNILLTLGNSLRGLFNETSSNA